LLAKDTPRAEIARAVGISRAILYRYLDAKEAATTLDHQTLTRARNHVA
jgi:AcrR family transcriptional regulator